MLEIFWKFRHKQRTKIEPKLLIVLSMRFKAGIASQLPCFFV